MRFLKNFQKKAKSGKKISCGKTSAAAEKTGTIARGSSAEPEIYFVSIMPT